MKAGLATVNDLITVFGLLLELSSVLGHQLAVSFYVSFFFLGVIRRCLGPIINLITYTVINAHVLPLRVVVRVKTAGRLCRGDSGSPSWVQPSVLSSRQPC